MVEATAGRDRHAYGASKRRAVVGREAPAEGGGDGARGLGVEDENKVGGHR